VLAVAVLAVAVLAASSPNLKKRLTAFLASSQLFKVIINLNHYYTVLFVILT